MALSKRLQELYASNDIGVMAYDTIELSHSLFSKTYYLIVNDEPKDLKIEDGTVHTFEPFAFNVIMPTKGSNQQDIGLVFDNVAQVGMFELERASANMKEPIMLKHRIYMDGDDTPQSSVLELELVNVSANARTITANASRINLFGRHVPTREFLPSVFRGIRS